MEFVDAVEDRQCFGADLTMGLGEGWLVETFGMARIDFERAATLVEIYMPFYELGILFVVVPSLIAVKI